jgi:hypothetical protein
VTVLGLAVAFAAAFAIGFVPENVNSDVGGTRPRLLKMHS